MRVAAAGPLIEWTPNDERTSRLHKQNSTLRRPPVNRPTRSKRLEIT